MSLTGEEKRAIFKAGARRILARYAWRHRSDHDLEDVDVVVLAPTCRPFTLDDLLTEDFNLDRALGMVAAAKADPPRDVLDRPLTRG